MSEDIEKLRLETENLKLKCALEFYAEGRHLWDADERDPACDAYDRVSGQVENGTYAFKTLREIEDGFPEKIEKLKEEIDVFRLYLSEIAVGFANGRNYTREDMIRMAKEALKGNEK